VASQLLEWDHAGLQEVTALKARLEAEVRLWKAAAQNRLFVRLFPSLAEFFDGGIAVFSQTRSNTHRRRVATAFVDVLDERQNRTDHDNHV
jgi:hypothetical protein